MKLSEIKGEAVLDVIADVIEPASRIMEDEEAASLFKRETCPEGMEPREFMASRIKRAVPKLMKGHKQDIIAILAAINQVEPEDYAESLTMASLINDVFDVLTDEDLLGFLSPSTAA